MTLQRRQIAPLILCLVLASAPPPLAAQPAPPQVPVPHAPTGGTRATDEFPTLRWSRLPSAQNYHVQLSAHPYPFSAPHLLEEATTADTAFTLSAVLDANRS